MHFIRALLVSVLAWFPADLTLGRAWLAILIGFGAAAAVYLLALPTELPLWPGACIIGGAAALGLLWEQRSR